MFICITIQVQQREGGPKRKAGEPDQATAPVEVAALPPAEHDEDVAESSTIFVKNLAFATSDAALQVGKSLWRCILRLHVNNSFARSCSGVSAVASASACKRNVCFTRTCGG